MPFPHVEQQRVVRRPALVIARHDGGPVGVLLWTLMRTNASRAAWPGDIIIPEAEALGLIIPSKVRTAKVTTVEQRSAIAIGRLDEDTLSQVRSIVARAFIPA